MAALSSTSGFTTLTAAVSPSDGPIEKVQFFQGDTLLGEVLSAPYSFSWQNVPVGAYSLTAKVIFNIVSEQVSPAVYVTVSAAAAQLHFIHVDHLNTPRLVANAAGQTVWLWHQAEAFGNNVPDENPSGLGVFDLPLRLPGQYFDKETNLNYNYHRDYDPQIGRYIQSDPIGLDGGLNLYSYVSASPVKFIDPGGLLRCRWIGLVLHCEWGPPSGGGASDWPRDTSKGSSSSSESNSGAKEKECPPDEDCNAEFTNCLVSGWGGKVGFDSACYACYEKCRGSSPHKWPDRVWTGTWNLYVSCEYWLTRIPK